MLGFTPRSNAGPYNISIFSRSCGIDMRDLYVVIGGVENDKGIRKVAIYNDNGFERTLPDTGTVRTCLCQIPEWKWRHGWCHFLLELI